MTSVHLSNPRAKPELRVLQIFGKLGVGGAETWLISLLRYFRQIQDELPFVVTTDVCLTSGTPGDFDQDAIDLGANLHYLRYSRRDLVSFTRGFRRLLASRRFHAIHDHQDYSAGIHMLLGLGKLPPVRIAHVHNPAYRLVEHTDAISRLVGKMGLRILRHAGTTVAGTSSQLLQEYGFSVDFAAGTYPKALYCGFDAGVYQGDQRKHRHELRAEFGWGCEDPVVLFVGRLGGEELQTGGRSHKNPMFALKTFRKSRQSRPNLRMLFVGMKGPMYAVLDKMVRDWNLEDSVRFLGVRHDVPRLMLGSSLLVFPSSAEGLGMVTVEAQAAGLRVLASNTTPLECVVVPELVNFLPLDAGVETWADKLLELIAAPAPDLKKSNDRVAASAFSVQSSARELLSLYTNGMSSAAIMSSSPDGANR